MAFRTWVRLLLATLGVGALAGASQLGVAYGLGIVRLTRVLDVTTRDQWTAQLAWVAWFAMIAAVIGALAGSWLLPLWSPTRPGTGTTVAIALAAGIGASVVVPLTMQPARTAQVAGVHPVFVIGICAGLGALAGAFAAAGALIQPVSRWSLGTLGAAVWAIAIVSVSPSLGPNGPLPAVRLGVFDASFLSPAVTQRTALFTMPAVALIVGALLGSVARRRDLPTLTIALAGLPGPALLTVAYLIAGPGAGEDRYQMVPYWAAMTATGAGVLGSVLAAVLWRGVPNEETDEDAPTEDRPPLPRRTGQAESSTAPAGAPRPEPGGTGGLTYTGVPAPVEGPGDRVPDPRTGADPGETNTSTAGSGGWPAGSHDASLGGDVGPGEHRGYGRQSSSVGPHTVAEPQPYVPAPATRPLPPELLARDPLESVRPEALTPTANARLGRSLRPFSRGRVDQPADGLNLGFTSNPGRTEGWPGSKQDWPGRTESRPGYQEDSPGGAEERTGRKQERPGRDLDRPGRHDATAGPDQQPETEPIVGKRRGWRRGKSSNQVKLGPSTPTVSDLPPAPTGRPPATADHVSPLDAFMPEPEDPAFPLLEGRPLDAKQFFAGAPIRDDRTPVGHRFTPEPQTISAPRPELEPITRPIARPEPVPPPPPAEKRRSSKQRRKDDDYVDWVSGLGKE